MSFGPSTSAFLLESLGVSRINHIFRVHGHTILNEETSAKTFADVGRRSLGRLSRTASHAQRRSVRNWFQEVSRCCSQVYLGALVATRPRIRDMVREATIAGPLPEQPLVPHLDNLIDTVPTAFRQ